MCLCQNFKIPEDVSFNKKTFSGGYKVWKRLSFFVAMPAVGLCMLNAYLKHQEEHDHPRQEFVKYDYLRRREKRFPWGEGNKSLFHNPHVNALPDGYEH